MKFHPNGLVGTPCDQDIGTWTREAGAVPNVGFVCGTVMPAIDSSWPAVVATGAEKVTPPAAEIAITVTAVVGGVLGWVGY